MNGVLMCIKGEKRCTKGVLMCNKGVTTREKESFSFADTSCGEPPKIFYVAVTMCVAGRIVVVERGENILFCFTYA